MANAHVEILNFVMEEQILAIWAFVAAETHKRHVHPQIITDVMMASASVGTQSLHAIRLNLTV